MVRCTLGPTRDLEHRVWEHKQGLFGGIYQEIQRKNARVLRRIFLGDGRDQA